MADSILPADDCNSELRLRVCLTLDVIRQVLPYL
jgi:hypothetical protein